MSTSPFTEIKIDLNVRVKDGLTYSDFDDVQGPFPVVGDRVWAVEPETSLRTHAIVVRIDPARGLVYLLVAWNALTSTPTVTDPAPAAETFYPNNG